MVSNINMHFYVASGSPYGLCLIMCNEMASLEVFPELRNSSSRNTCNSILLARWKTACIFEKAGFLGIFPHVHA